MVSLRRKPRPSYNIAANLGISDDERSESDPEANAEAGPSTLPRGSPKRKRPRQPSVDSSGADSAFVPPEEEDELQSDNGDADVEMDAAPEDYSQDEDMKGMDSDNSQDLVEVSQYDVREQKVPGRRHVHEIKGSSDGVKSYSTLDPTYQELLWRDASYDPRKAKSGHNTGKPFISPVENMVHGPLTPLGKTRLAALPDGRSLPKLVPTSQDLGHENRQRVQNRLVKFVPSEVPWDAWEGDSWRPGATVVSAKGKGKDTTKQGYESIGRLDLDQAHIISAVDAFEYLPTPLDRNNNPYITCLMGPTGAQQPVRFASFDWRHIGDFSSVKQGFVFSAGGPIWGLDWCPIPDNELSHREWRHYLAVSSLPSIQTPTSIGEKWPSTSSGCIQIWSMITPEVASRRKDAAAIDKGRMHCDIVLCIKGGCATEIKWLPSGAYDKFDAKAERQSIPKLGIIAATLLDGSVALYSVPDPFLTRSLAGVTDEDGPLFLEAQPILKLQVDDTCHTCLDWAAGSRLAVGCSNGHLAVYDVRNALLRKKSTVLPTIFTPLCQGHIRSVVWLGIPDVDTQGKIELDSPPPMIMCASIDGSISSFDTRDNSHGAQVHRTRLPAYTTAWMPHLGIAVIPNNEATLDSCRVRMESYGRGSKMSDHLGPIWTAAASDYHVMVATGSADGSLSIVNAEVGARKLRKRAILKSFAYEMDYDRKEDIYRMTDDVLPEITRRDTAETRRSVLGKSKMKIGYHAGQTIAATWPPEVGIHRACWNNGNGIGRAGYLLSGTASGLARVDFINGEYMKNKNIWDLEVTRGEAGGDLGSDDDDE